MTEIRNTTADMNTPGSPDLLLFLLSGMDGETDRFIENQERAGQQELVRSEMLPTDTGRAPDADFETVGFTFGKPLDNDPLFRPATLPPGWSKQGSDHDMWSDVVDELGRKRVAVFYKAAFYDRRAFMRLVDIDEYVYSHVNGYADMITDNVWATPEAVAAAALRLAADHQEQIEKYTGWLSDETNGRAKFAKERLPEEAERHAACVALAERLVSGGTE